MVQRRQSSGDESIDRLLNSYREEPLDLEEGEDLSEEIVALPAEEEYADCSILRSQALAALDAALEDDWMSEFEIGRIVTFFRQELDSLLQVAIGEAGLHALGKRGRKHAVKRAARRVGKDRS